MKPGLSERGCILACMRIDEVQRAPAARSSSLIALANGTSNRVVAPRGGRSDEGPYMCAGRSRADAWRADRSCDPAGELPGGPGRVGSGGDAGSRRDARLMAFIRTAPYSCRRLLLRRADGPAAITGPPSMDLLGEPPSRFLAKHQRRGRCRTGACRVPRHGAGSTQPTIATYCEAAARITSAWKTS
jgi:hypothetical protein